MPGLKKEDSNLSANEQGLVARFKAVASAETPQDKQMAFIQLIGSMNKAKQDPASVVRPGDVTDTITRGDKNG